MPVRDAVPVFDDTEYLMVPFPDPLAVVTVSHDTDDFAFHDTLAVTPSVMPLAAFAVKVRLPEASDSAGFGVLLFGGLLFDESS